MSKQREMVLSGLFVTLLIISALVQFRLPLTNIPITLQTFVILIIGSFFSVKQSVFVILTYLFLGIIGIPVFANFSGGLSYLVGPTGGFLLGFIPGIIFVSISSNYFRKNKKLTKKSLFFIGIIFTLIVYFCGVFFLYISYFYTNGVSTTLKRILVFSILPFIPGDVIKITLFSLVYPSVEKIKGKNIH